MQSLAGLRWVTFVIAQGVFLSGVQLVLALIDRVVCSSCPPPSVAFFRLIHKTRPHSGSLWRTMLVVPFRVELGIRRAGD